VTVEASPISLGGFDEFKSGPVRRLRATPVKLTVRSTASRFAAKGKKSRTDTTAPTGTSVVNRAR
jgi:hypothetical protein